MHDVVLIAERLLSAPKMNKRCEHSYLKTFAASFARQSHALSVATFDDYDVLNLLIKGIPAQAIDGFHAADLTAHMGAVMCAVMSARGAQALDIEAVKEMHAHIMIQDPFAGWFRSPRITVGEKGELIFHARAKTLTRHLEDYERRVEDGQDAMASAAECHLHFIALQPFLSANARVARLVLLHQLIRAGYPPFALSAVQKDRYIRALQCRDRDDLVALIEESVEAAVARRITATKKAAEAGGFTSGDGGGTLDDDMIRAFIG